MTRAFFACGTLAALAAAAACATTEEALTRDQPSNPASTPASDGGADREDNPILDGGGPDAMSCSKGGWCVTPLPDPDLTLTDVWPLETRAFAIAESETLGIKVLEWEQTTNEWRYIDDNSHNAYGFGRYPGKIWAAHENEIYYAVAPSFVYRGTRAAPGSPWAWERDRLEDHSHHPDPQRDHGLATYKGTNGKPIDYPALGVWGSSVGDVYAWYANTIFHRRIDDGGAPVWDPEYVIEDAEHPADTFFVFGASGSSADDVWFAVGRAQLDESGTFGCPMVIRRSGGSYERIVDSNIEGAGSSKQCVEKPGALIFTNTWWDPVLEEHGLDPMIFPFSTGGWLTSIASSGPGTVVGTVAGENLAFVTADDGGSARLTPFAPYSMTSPWKSPPFKVSSAWAYGPVVWMSGWGVVVQTANEPTALAKGFTFGSPAADRFDGAELSISSTALNAPLNTPFHQVRGTSNSNIWAVGAHYALHKTTP